MAAVAKSYIKKGGVLVGTRRGFNFVEGAGILISAADDDPNEEVDLTFALDTSVLQNPTTGDLKLSLQTANHGNWLLCQGGSFVGATWPNLQTLLGGTTLPDLRGRAPIGSGTGSGLTARTLKGTGGTETHQLTEAELAVHDHDMSQHQHVMDHTHTITEPNGGLGHVHESAPNNSQFWVNKASGNAFLSDGAVLGMDLSSFTEPSTTGITINSVGATFKTSQAGAGGTSNTTNTAGSGTAHNNMQPWYAVNFFIYAA